MLTELLINGILIAIWIFMAFYVYPKCAQERLRTVIADSDFLDPILESGAAKIASKLGFKYGNIKAHLNREGTAAINQLEQGLGVDISSLVGGEAIKNLFDKKPILGLAYEIFSSNPEVLQFLITKYGANAKLDFIEPSGANTQIGPPR